MPPRWRSRSLTPPSPHPTPSSSTPLAPKITWSEMALLQLGRPLLGQVLIDVLSCLTKGLASCLGLLTQALAVIAGNRCQLLPVKGLAAAREHPATLKDPAPDAFLEKFGDSTIDFQLVVWSEEMSYRPRRFRSDLNFAIERKLREAGIVIPFPQRDIRIISTPAHAK